MLAHGFLGEGTPMFCPTCGNQVADDSAFCPACGTDMQAARQVSQGGAGYAPAPQAGAYPASGEYPGPPSYGAYPGQPGAGAPARKSNAGLIVGLIIGGVLLLTVLMGVGGWIAYRSFVGATQTPTSASTAAKLSASTTAGSSSVSVAAAASPNAAVDAWYLAVANGDMVAIKRAATSEFASAIDSAMFEGRDPKTSYRITGTQISGDQATVDVQESPSNAPAQLATTFTVRKQADGTWLIAEWQVAATGDQVGATKSSASQPAAATPAPTFGEKDAIDTVGRFLNDIKDGDGSLAKKLATSRFKSANPGWIFGPLSEYSFEVTGAKKQGNAWAVTVDEQWQSGPEKATYTVVVVNGAGKVDRRNGLN
jgi:hypothetical protein